METLSSWFRIERRPPEGIFMLTLNSFTTQSIYVTKVQPDGPAAFGLVPGDRILEVTKALVFDAFFFSVEVKRD